MNKSEGKVTELILSIILGISTAAIVFISLNIILLIFAGLFPFLGSSDSFLGISVSIVLPIIASCFMGGYVNGLFSEKKFIHYSLITGIALAIIYLSLGGANLNGSFFNIIGLLLIIPFVWIGAYIANKKNPN